MIETNAALASKNDTHDARALPAGLIVAPQRHFIVGEMFPYVSTARQAAESRQHQTFRRCGFQVPVCDAATPARAMRAVHASGCSVSIHLHWGWLQRRGAIGSTAGIGCAH